MFWVSFARNIIFLVFATAMFAFAAYPEDRLALIIDMTVYSGGVSEDGLQPIMWDSLATPANDSSLLAASLIDLGFETKNIKRISDGNYSDTLEGLYEFAELVAGASDDAVIIVYFAGHAFERYSKSRDAKDLYLVPVDATISKPWHIEERTISLARVAEIIVHAKAENSKFRDRVYAFIIDACRQSVMLPQTGILDRAATDVVSFSGTPVRGTAADQVIGETLANITFRYSTNTGYVALDSDPSAPNVMRSPFSVNLIDALNSSTYLSEALDKAMKRVEIATPSGVIVQIPTVSGTQIRDVLLRPDGRNIDSLQASSLNDSLDRKYQSPSAVEQGPPDNAGILNIVEAHLANKVDKERIFISAGPGEILRISQDIYTGGRILEIRADNTWIDGNILIQSFTGSPDQRNGRNGEHATPLKINPDIQRDLERDGKEGSSGLIGGDGENGRSSETWIIDVKRRINISGSLRLFNRGESGGTGGQGGNGSNGADGADGFDATVVLALCQKRPDNGGDGGKGGNGGNGGNGGDGGRGGDIVLSGALANIPGSLSDLVRIDLSGGNAGRGGDGGIAGLGGRGGAAGKSSLCPSAEAGEEGDSGINGAKGKSGNVGQSGTLYSVE